MGNLAVVLTAMKGVPAPGWVSWAIWDMYPADSRTGPITAGKVKAQDGWEETAFVVLEDALRKVEAELVEEPHLPGTYGALSRIRASAEHVQALQTALDSYDSASSDSRRS